EKRRIEFKTLTSDLTYNDGYYKFEDSPDGKRCLVKSLFIVKQGQGLSLGALGQATRESFLTAARGVKKRASAPPTRPPRSAIFGQRAIERHRSAAADHDGECEADREDVVLESLARLLPGPVHEEAVRHVDGENRHHHVAEDAERGHASEQADDQPQGAEELG